ncbi:S-adenosyl-L-methionine-dependent methyltransferase [Nadsonia fulvescens var. elongata DSM 6958]|uniref:type I protein arginine methyltransferase n=1 Tax=Nadsonia fulvescens var. elongata DSM 6958 TaxID=857566 RepID=A0A1E3PGG3_9ASCO|nr:S-adenosyl-L-methionine-dependent methyltransferase [Nadsonia fulvescens var. elongata DSM 6958]
MVYESDSDSEIDFQTLSAQDNELEFDSDEYAESDDEENQSSLFQSLHNPQEKFKTVESLWEYELTQHNFDWKKLVNGKGYEFFDKIKLINYIRKTQAVDIDHINAKELSEEYLKPVLENDAVLFSFEDEEDFDKDIKFAESQERSKKSCQPSNEEDAMVEDDHISYDSLSDSDKVKILESKLKNLTLQLTTESELPDIIIGEPTSVTGNSDTNYFDSYAQFEIHEIMLKDKIRTESYRDFIYQNKDVFKGKIVMDIGCGTGILSMFAAKAGAKQVLAVDNSDIIEIARKNVKQNDLEDNITFLKGKAEEVELPEGIDKVDIIVSEWMGYGLLYESMLDSVIVARNKHLRPKTGLMAPGECRIILQASNEEDFYNDKLNYWNDVYGFKMNAIREKINLTFVNEAQVEIFGKDTIISDHKIIKALPLHDVEVEDLSFKTDFKLNINATSTLTMLNIYFDTFFQSSREHIIEPTAVTEDWPSKGQNGVTFTTGPQGTPTHWRSCGLYLNTPVDVNAGDVIDGTVEFRKGDRFQRDLEIIITAKINGGIQFMNKQKYHIH